MIAKAGHQTTFLSSRATVYGWLTTASTIPDTIATQLILAIYHTDQRTDYPMLSCDDVGWAITAAISLRLIC